MTAANGGGPRIVFVGTCQVNGLAASARRMAPEAHIEDHVIGHHFDAQQIRDRLGGADIVFTQIDATHPDGALLSPAAIGLENAQVLFLPPAVFTGFQPDITYVGGVPAGHGPYHSQIALGAFLNGLDADRAYRLFNAHVFHRLGYFERYEAAVAGMAGIFEDAGYPMRPALQAFRDEGCVFMHTINHPAIALSWRIAALALGRVGLADPFARMPADMPDDLAEGIMLPVLPALARRIGVPGSDMFIRAAPEAGDEPRALPMRSFVRASYDVYRHLDPAILQQQYPQEIAARLAAVLD